VQHSFPKEPVLKSDEEGRDIAAGPLDTDWEAVIRVTLCALRPMVELGFWALWEFIYPVRPIPPEHSCLLSWNATEVRNWAVAVQSSKGTAEPGASIPRRAVSISSTIRSFHRSTRCGRCRLIRSERFNDNAD
jgi:hypothetical protein